MSNEKPFHIARDGQVIGQLSEAEFQQKIFASEILPEDFFWCEGFADWKPVNEYHSCKSKPTHAATPRQWRSITPARAGTDTLLQKWAARVKRDSRSPAQIGGLCAIAAVFAPLVSPLFFIFFSLPLLLAAFILSIMCIIRSKIGAGIMLMIGVFIAFPFSFVAFLEREQILDPSRAVIRAAGRP